MTVYLEAFIPFNAVTFTLGLLLAIVANVTVGALTDTELTAVNSPLRQRFNGRPTSYVAVSVGTRSLSISSGSNEPPPPPPPPPPEAAAKIVYPR